MIMYKAFAPFDSSNREKHLFGYPLYNVRKNRNMCWFFIYPQSCPQVIHNTIRTIIFRLPYDILNRLNAIQAVSFISLQALAHISPKYAF